MRDDATIIQDGRTQSLVQALVLAREIAAGTRESLPGFSTNWSLPGRHYGGKFSTSSSELKIAQVEGSVVIVEVLSNSLAPTITVMNGGNAFSLRYLENVDKSNAHRWDHRTIEFRINGELSFEGTFNPSTELWTKTSTNWRNEFNDETFSSVLAGLQIMETVIRKLPRTNFGAELDDVRMPPVEQLNGGDSQARPTF
jgi:hypothetical protein